MVGDQTRLRGYLAEDALWRVQPGAQGRFIADDPRRSAVPVTLEAISPTGVRYLDIDALASDQSGPIPVRRDPEGRAEPVKAHYAAQLSQTEPRPTPTRMLRGQVVLIGEPESLLGAAWRRLAALGVRESGF